jgi:hypothetical protein
VDIVARRHLIEQECGVRSLASLADSAATRLELPATDGTDARTGRGEDPILEAEALARV